MRQVKDLDVGGRKEELDQRARVGRNDLAGFLAEIPLGSGGVGGIQDPGPGGGSLSPGGQGGGNGCKSKGRGGQGGGRIRKETRKPWGGEGNFKGRIPPPQELGGTLIQCKEYEM